MSSVQLQPKKTTPWVWIGLGCGIAFLGLIAFIVFVFFIAAGAMRGSEPYKEAMRRAQSDPRVIEALGTPVKPGMLVSGTTSFNNDDGSAKLDIPISGPKGSAKLHVTATKTDGKWYYNRIVVTRGNEPEIDLMTSP